MQFNGHFNAECLITAKTVHKKARGMKGSCCIGVSFLVWGAGAGFGGRWAADGVCGAAGTRHAPRPEDWHLRRAGRRTAVGGLCALHWPGLRELLTLPSAHCKASRCAGSRQSTTRCRIAFGGRQVIQ